MLGFSVAQDELFKKDNSSDLTHFSERSQFHKKNRTKYLLDIQGAKLSGAKCEPLPNRKKSLDMTHYFSKVAYFFLSRRVTQDTSV